MTKIDITSVVCKECRLPAALDENGVCGPCVVLPKGKASQVTEPNSYSLKFTYGVLSGCLIFLVIYYLLAK